MAFDIKAEGSYVDGAPGFDMTCTAMHDHEWLACEPKPEGRETGTLVEALWITTSGTEAPYKVMVSRTWSDK